ncbi:serine hydrolase [Paralcaligenes ureilyticus]|uniref:CubicO group peptidase (Beta-lactamase class C family) n=1 Tax=Paralcaligenes ureilyticus TaxID=627131 RepID=A0A4R3M6F0_9BURK|nr:serine hydrolase [Paralcaligenes ureilyticus]TCT08642.1 CubicO group peptidase (beta-lactamase class C family) [Paralcaligenes ureilyticus]
MISSFVLRPVHTAALGISAVFMLSAMAHAAPTPPTASQLAPERTAGVPIVDGQIDRAIAQLDALADSVMKKSGIPGMSVAVVKDGKTVYAKGFGVRKIGEDARVDADTVFQLASLSKALGSTVVAHQVGEGIIRWKTPVVKHLPWFALDDPWVTQHVTIGDLFSHRSGLPDLAGEDLINLGYNKQEIIKSLRFLRLKPFRNSYSYSSMGLTAAAESVAAASGEDWATLSQNVLYGPLGMSSTSSRYADFAKRSDRAYAHIRGAHGFEAIYTPQTDSQAPAGGASSSANDMAKWMAMVLQYGRYQGRRIVAKDALLPAITPQTLTHRPTSASARSSFYGYGFNVGIQPSGRVMLSHSGALTEGVATTFELIPSAHVGIVVLSNASPVGAVEALAVEFTELVQLGTITRDWYSLYANAMAGMDTPFGELAGQHPPMQANTGSPPASYTGTYTNNYFGPITVKDHAGKLLLTIGPQNRKYTLQPWGKNRFVFPLSTQYEPPGSVSSADFTMSDTGKGKSLMIEFLNRNGQGTFVRRGN